VVDELRRRRAERLEQAPMERLVRPVVEAAHDVRDPEVDIVDDGRELIGRRAVLAQQRDAVEAIPERGSGLAVTLLALTLPHRPLVPLEPEPLKVADDLLLAAGHVPSGVGVVDPEEHPVAEHPVGDGAEGVPDVQGTGWTGCETDSLHLRPSLESEPVEAALLAWFDAHGRDLPWRRTRDPYAILVSEVMLQQTQVDRVVQRYLAWLERWPAVEALAAATPADVIRAWQGLGYNRRGLNLHRAARQIAADGWPDDLTELPGVGPYTAAAVASFAFGRAVLPVDTNVRRVRDRTGQEFSPHAGQALMDLGAAVCLARIPRCGVCPLASDCPSRGRRYEPLCKQSRFEGSFRQRRANTLRLVAAADRTLQDLDADAVESLARDGLVTVEAGMVALPAA
jgi:A/G-specific adenine glycosylase